MLLSLQGKTHVVMTGVWVCSPGKCGGFVDAAEVTFYPMTREEAAAYAATGEPLDKAGAYAIQGRGMRFIRGIRGDFYTVMGLPAPVSPASWPVRSSRLFPPRTGPQGPNGPYPLSIVNKNQSFCKNFGLPS